MKNILFIMITVFISGCIQQRDNFCSKNPTSSGGVESYDCAFNNQDFTCYPLADQEIGSKNIIASCKTYASGYVLDFTKQIDCCYEPSLHFHDCQWEKIAMICPDLPTLAQ